MNMRRITMVAAVLIGVAASVGGAVTSASAAGRPAVAAQTAPASVRLVYTQLFFGPPSITIPECRSAGQADVRAGDFPSYICVASPYFVPNPYEELEGFDVIG
ncbi:MAG TPA: hypothetical protein VGL06_00180 [Pseudonocardiaceae bacterium]